MKEKGTGETGGAPVRERSDATMDDVVGNVQQDFTGGTIREGIQHVLGALHVVHRQADGAVNTAAAKNCLLQPLEILG